MIALSPSASPTLTTSLEQVLVTTDNAEKYCFYALPSAVFSAFCLYQHVRSWWTLSRASLAPSQHVSALHYCAYATGCTENRSLLTEQALPL